MGCLLPTQSYFQLTSPLIFLVFCVAFTVIWRYARDSVPVRLFALAFLSGAIATLADFFRPVLSTPVVVIAVNIPATGMALAFCSALFHYYTGRIPVRPFIAAFLALLAAVAWFAFAGTDIVMRVIVINAAGAGLLASTAFALHRHARRSIDRVLQALLTVIALCLACRVAYVAANGGAGLTETNYATSGLGISMHFIAALGALAAATVLFVMVGMEIVMHLVRISETDPLTGALNRRGLDARVRALAGQQPGGGERCHAIVMADIDAFKSVNDGFGHEAGDRVIARFAEILAQTARDGDTVVRWGGEEFLVVLADADMSLARIYAETVRTTFAATHHDCMAGGATTASFGVAVWNAGRPVTSAAELADKALYRAKNMGRNRVCVAPPEAPRQIAEHAELAVA